MLNETSIGKYPNFNIEIKQLYCDFDGKKVRPTAIVTCQEIYCMNENDWSHILT